MDEEGSEKPISRVRIAKGSMVCTREQRDSRKYTIRNSDTQPRQVVIEHPARDGWKLAEGAKPEEITESFLRFRVSVPPGQSQELKIEEYHPEETTYELSKLEDKQVTLIAEQNNLSPAVQDVFRKVLSKKNEISGLESQIGVREKEAASIDKDQARLRENMKALKGSAEEKALLQRYTRQLDSQEDRLAVLHKEVEDLNGKKARADEELDQMLQAITLDEKF
jgi:hypothetical protein